MYTSPEFAAIRSGIDTRPQREAQQLWRRLRALRQCTLTTRTPYGEPHLRSLRLQNRSLDAGEPLWFFIERGSDLVLDVNTDPKVELEFTDRDGNRIHITGQASIAGRLDEAAFTSQHTAWQLPSWRSLDDTRRLALLRVDVGEVRYIDRAPGQQPAQARLAFA